MSYETNPYPELKTRFAELNFDIKKCIYFLPENLFESNHSSNFIYPESTTDLRKICRANNVPLEYLFEDKPLLRSRKSADWFGPTLFIGATLPTENPTIVGVTLNVLSSYLYDFFKGKAGEPDVKFDIVIGTKKGGDYRKITYEGGISAIKDLEIVIEALKK